MKISFTIEYWTRWGENLVLRSGDKAFPMSYVADGMWSVGLEDILASDCFNKMVSELIAASGRC